jgi:hypothetical protein
MVSMGGEPMPASAKAIKISVIRSDPSPRRIFWDVRTIHHCASREEQAVPNLVARPRDSGEKYTELGAFAARRRFGGLSYGGKN